MIGDGLFGDQMYGDAVGVGGAALGIIKNWLSVSAAMKLRG